MDTELGDKANLLSFLSEKLLAYFDPGTGHVVDAELTQDPNKDALMLRFSLCIEGLVWLHDRAWTKMELLSTECPIGVLIEQELREAVAEAGY